MANFTVTNLNDTGAGSLRAAIALANAAADADTIDFTAGLAGTIVLTSGSLAITQDLIINGDTNGDIAADIAISGNNTSQVITISGASTDATLSSLTVENGYYGGGGGGINANSVSMLTIENSTIRNNESVLTGGGIAASFTTLLITGSTIYGNTSGAGGGGIFSDDTTTTLTNTTVHNNVAERRGGGIAQYDFSGTNTLTLNNSTITGNRGDSNGVGGYYGGGLLLYNGIVDFNNTVVADNIIGSGAGIGDDVSQFGAATNIYAGNSFFGTAINGAYTDNGGNDNGVTGDPLLGALLDNGGPVNTRLLQAASPLIDAGANVLVPGGITTDANGDARIVGGTVDIGAVEAGTNRPPVANNDAVGPVNENVVLNGASSVFADNGSGADNDPEGDPFFVTEVEGNAANVGVQFALASGALLLVNADGTFSYDPNGTQDALPDPASGASNLTATDTFTYTITDGDTATVTVTIAGVDSNDTLIGTNIPDTLIGGIGDDNIDGLDGPDTIDYSGTASGVTVNLNVTAAQNTGGAGNDTIANVENIVGSNNNDRLIGKTGVDGGDNILSGGAGNDQLFGIGGDDTLNGGAGNDLALGGAGNDTVNGNAGDDLLLGGIGDDVITGGLGRDFLFGQAGTDTFVFNDIAETGLTFADRDIIRDFSQADGDKIDLSGIDAITGGSDNAFTFLGTLAAPTFTNNAGELLAVNTVGGQTVVWGDVDGDGVRDFTFVLDGTLTLTTGDFIL